MAVNFSESKTKENLMRAFAGESQARNRYTIAAERAEEEGMYTIADVFRYTADQERAHAERFYNLLKDLSGETIHIDGTYPIDQQDNLEGLLRAAEHNEHEEYADVYQAFGDTRKWKASSKLHPHSTRSRRSSTCTKNALEGWLKCSRRTCIIAQTQFPNGCVQTADISMKDSLRQRYALSAGTSRAFSSHTQWHVINCRNSTLTDIRLDDPADLQQCAATTSDLIHNRRCCHCCGKSNIFKPLCVIIVFQKPPGNVIFLNLPSHSRSKH